MYERDAKGKIIRVIETNRVEVTTHKASGATVRIITKEDGSVVHNYDY